MPATGYLHSECHFYNGKVCSLWMHTGCTCIHNTLTDMWKLIGGRHTYHIGGNVLTGRRRRHSSALWWLVVNDKAATSMMHLKRVWKCINLPNQGTVQRPVRGRWGYSGVSGVRGFTVLSPNTAGFTVEVGHYCKSEGWFHLLWPAWNTFVLSEYTRIIFKLADKAC